jgi:hypothetical protein
MTEQTAPPANDDEQASLRDRIAQALEAADYSGKMRRGDLADAVMPVVASALREADQLAAGVGRSATTYARRYEKSADRLRATRRTLNRHRSTLAAVRNAMTDAKACDGDGCTVDHRDVVIALLDDGAPEVLPLAVAIGQRDAAYRAHNADIGLATDRQFALQKALRSPRPAAGWDYLIERAAVVVAELETERTKHEEHRRAVCEALGRHTGLDWPTAIDRVQQAVADRARLTDEHEAHRLSLAEALKWDEACPWPDLIESAAATERDATRAEAQRDQAVIAQGAAEQAARQARQGESDAVRARKAAEADRDSFAAQLAGRRVELAAALGWDGSIPWPDLLAEVGQRGRDEGARRTQLREARQLAERAEDARDSAAQSAANLLGGVIRVRQMADAWEQQLPDTIRTATVVDAIRTALGDPQPSAPSDRRRPCRHPRCIGAHQYMLNAKVYDCPGPAAGVREQPAEPLLRGTPPEVHVTVSVSPEQVRAAVRRIIREDGITLMDVTE